MSPKYKVSPDVVKSFHDGHGPTVIHRGDLTLWVCVPFDMPDDQVEKFANDEHPKEGGVWKLTPGDHPILGDDPTRASCVMHEDQVHMYLDFRTTPELFGIGKRLESWINRLKFWGKSESIQQVPKRAGWWDERD